MELPFYLNFTDFENNYYENLEKWFEEYHNTTETDYLKALTELYSPYLYYSFAINRLQADASIQIKNCFFPYYEKIGISFCTSCDDGKKALKSQKINHQFEWKTITMMEYAQYILDRINSHLTKNLNKEGNVHDFINNHEIITSREGAGYCINYHQHLSTIPFLKAYLPVDGQTVDIAVYRDFVFSIVQIAEYIDRKLREVQTTGLTIYSKLKSEAKFKVQMSHQFLTICN